MKDWKVCDCGVENDYVFATLESADARYVIDFTSNGYWTAIDREKGEILSKEVFIKLLTNKNKMLQ